MNTTKKLLSVLVASLLLVACVVGMLIVGANAADDVTWTIDEVGGTSTTYKTISDALAAAKEMTWPEGSTLTLIVDAQDKEDDHTPGKLLFNAETIWAGNERLPITIKSKEGTNQTLWISGKVDVACANSYTFENLTFRPASGIWLYAGSGEVTFKNVSWAGTGLLGVYASGGGPDIGNAAFAGWEDHLPQNGEKIVTSVTFDGVNVPGNSDTFLYAFLDYDFSGHGVTPDMTHAKIIFKNGATFGKEINLRKGTADFARDVSFIAENTSVPNYVTTAVNETSGNTTLSLTNCTGVTANAFSYLVRSNYVSNGNLTVSLNNTSVPGFTLNGVPEGYKTTLNITNNSSVSGAIELTNNGGSAEATVENSEISNIYGTKSSAKDIKITLDNATMNGAVIGAGSSASISGNLTVEIKNTDPASARNVLALDDNATAAGDITMTVDNCTNINPYLYQSNPSASAISVGNVEMTVKDSTLPGALNLYSGIAADKTITAASTTLEVINSTVPGRINVVTNDVDVTSPLSMKLENCKYESEGVVLLRHANQVWTGDVDIDILGEDSKLEVVSIAHGSKSKIDGALSVDISGGTFSGDVQLGQTGDVVATEGMSLKISAGTFKGAVYAGVKNGDDKAGTTVDILGGTFEQQLTIGSQYQMAPLSLTISGTPVISGLEIKGAYNGDASFTAVYDADITYPENFHLSGSSFGESVNVTVKQGTFNGTTYIAHTPKTEAGTITTTIEGGSFNGPLYLGAETQSGVIASITNTITGGNFASSVYGGSTNGTVGTITNTITGGTYTSIYANGFAGGNEAGTVGTITNTFTGGLIYGHLVAGSAGGDVTAIQTEISGDIYVGRNCFGGNGGAGTVGSIQTTISGNVSIGTPVEESGASAGCFIGGSRNGEVTGTITTQINGGNIKGMYTDMYEGTHSAASATTITKAIFTSNVTAGGYQSEAVTTEATLTLDLSDEANVVTIGNDTELLVKAKENGKVVILAGEGKINLNNAVQITADEVTGGAVNVEFIDEPNDQQTYIIAPAETQYVVLNEYETYVKDGDLIAGVEVQPVDAIEGVSFLLDQKYLAVNLYLKKAQVEMIPNFALQVTFKGEPLAVGALEESGDYFKVSLGEFNASDFDEDITIAAEGMIPYVGSLMDIAVKGADHYSKPENEDPEMVALMKAIYTYGYQASQKWDGNVNEDVDDNYVVESYTGDYTGRQNSVNNVADAGYTIDGLVLVLENEVGYRIYSMTEEIPENYEIWVAGQKLDLLEIEKLDTPVYDAENNAYYTTFAFGVDAITMSKDIVINVRVDGELAASATVSIPAACEYYINHVPDTADVARAILIYIEAVENYF